MENKAHYALIGTFVLLALLAGTFFVTWLSGRQFDQAYDEYTVEFSGAVRGLSRGSEVRLNGLNVGEVTRLSFGETNPNLVFVTVQVIDNSPIFEDGYAQLEPLGLTGLNYLQINPGTATLARMNPLNQKIPGRTDQFSTLIEGGESIIDETALAIRKVNILMNEETIEDFQGFLANLNTLSANFQDADVDTQLIANTLKAWEQAGINTSDAALAVKQSAAEFDSLLNDRVAPAFEAATTAMESADATIKELERLAQNGSLTAEELRTAVDRLSTQGFADLEDTTDAMRELMITLNNIAEQLERNPAQFLAGGEQEVMELPQ